MPIAVGGRAALRTEQGVQDRREGDPQRLWTAGLGDLNRMATGEREGPREPAVL